MGSEDHGSPSLPVRTTRHLRPGRHSSPHQLSLPAEVPALVLAVPGAASPASEEIAAEIAAWAGASCPGATITAGYLEGSENHLGKILSGLHSRLPAVVVPLLTCPYPSIDEAIAAIVAAADTPVLMAEHLGHQDGRVRRRHDGGDRLVNAGIRAGEERDDDRRKAAVQAAQDLAEVVLAALQIAGGDGGAGTGGTGPRRDLGRDLLARRACRPGYGKHERGDLGRQGQLVRAGVTARPEVAGRADRQ